MRRLLIGMALVVALLGAIGLGAAQPALALHMGAMSSHTLVVDGGGTPQTPVCPGGGSTSCH